jgi:hypothetical protein
MIGVSGAPRSVAATESCRGDADQRKLDRAGAFVAGKIESGDQNSPAVSGLLMPESYLMVLSEPTSLL